MAASAFHFHASALKVRSLISLSTHAAPVFSATDPEEFPALLDHVCQAMSGSQVLIQVSLVRLSQCLLPVYHPLTEEGERDRWTQQN